jgi:hypothetical protein
MWWAGGQFDGDGCVTVRNKVQLFIKFGKATSDGTHVLLRKNAWKQSPPMPLRNMLSGC